MKKYGKYLQAQFIGRQSQFSPFFVLKINKNMVLHISKPIRIFVFLTKVSDEEPVYQTARYCRNINYFFCLKIIRLK